MGIAEIVSLALVFVFKFVLPAIGVGAVAATVTPNKANSGNPIAQVLLDGVNLLGANVGRASNRE